MQTSTNKATGESEAIAPSGPEARRALRGAVIVICLGTIVSNGASTTALGNLPLRFVLKNQLHLTQTAMALFLAVAGFAWYLKPLAGILSDAMPLWGTRRRHYLLLGGALGALAWLLLAIVPRTYLSLLIPVCVLECMLVVCSTALGALSVDYGRAYGAFGRLSGLRTGGYFLAGLVSGPVGGFLAERAFGLTAAVGVGMLCLLFVLVLLLLREAPLPRSEVRLHARFGAQFKTLFRSRTLWHAAAMVFLFSFSPGFQTPLYYYQTNMLKFSSQFIGNLAVVNGGCGALGAVFYGLMCRRLHLRPLLALSIAISAGTILLYLLYRSRGIAIGVEAANGFSGALVLAALMDLAARATPRGSEAVGYALLMGVANLAGAISDVLGSWLIDHFHLRFMQLVGLNAGTTAIMMVFIPLVPLALIRRRDGEADNP